MKARTILPVRVEMHSARTDAENVEGICRHICAQADMHDVEMRGVVECVMSGMAALGAHLDGGPPRAFVERLIAAGVFDDASMKRLGEKPR